MTVKAVILIGGPQKGTRFRPLSLECPKPLFPIAGYPTIQHHVESLVNVPGLSEILMLGFYQHGELAPFVEQMRRAYPTVVIRYLQEFASLGTAGGIYHFRDQLLIGDPTHIFIINADVCGDIPYVEMLDFMLGASGSLCTILVTEATRGQSVNYGCVVTNDRFEVEHYVDKPSTYVSNHISCGIYCVAPDLFAHLAEAFHRRVADHANHLSGAQSLTQNHDDVELKESPETLWFERDVFPTLAATGKLHSYHTTRWWSQIKTAAAAIYANRHCLSLYRTKRPDRLFDSSGDAAPTIQGDVFIHPTARVDPTAVIGPNVSIGANVTIGAGARIKESIVLDGAVIHDHACVLHAVVGWNSVVGFWSRVEGTPAGPNPNMAFAKMENKSLFNKDGRLNPSITILGCGVQVPRETILLNSIVLPHKELSGSCHNQIIL